MQVKEKREENEVGEEDESGKVCQNLTPESIWTGRCFFCVTWRCVWSL